MQPFRAHRPRWLIWLGLPAVLIALHTLYWQWLCRRLEADSQDWMAQRSVAGWHLGTGAAVTGGWPLAAELTLPGPFATAPDGGTGIVVFGNDTAPCFVAGTRILTVAGERAAEALRPLRET